MCLCLGGIHSIVRESPLRQYTCIHSVTCKFSKTSTYCVFFCASLSLSAESTETERSKKYSCLRGVQSLKCLFSRDTHAHTPQYNYGIQNTVTAEISGNVTLQGHPEGAIRWLGVEGRFLRGVDTWVRSGWKKNGEQTSDARGEGKHPNSIVCVKTQGVAGRWQMIC